LAFIPWGFSYFLTGVTLLDVQEFDWLVFSGMIQNAEFFTMNPPAIGVALEWFKFDLFDRKEQHRTFIQFISLFLMDQVRAGPYWVNPWSYVVLAKQISKILADK